MSRIRTIKPEFWTSEQVMECSPLSRLAFIGMWNFCDDQGVHPASVKTLKAEIFPADDISSVQVGAMVDELLASGLLVEFTANGKSFWFVTGWRHQLIKNASAPKYPTPPASIGYEDYPSPTPALPQPYPSPTVGEDPVREGKGSIKGKEEDQKQKPSAAGRPGVDARPEKPAPDGAVRFDPAGFLIEQGAEPETAADYLTLRNGKRAAATKTALQQIVAEAGKAGLPLQATLELCCARGWAGFRAEWAEQPARAGPRQSIHDQRKNTLDELTGRNRHDPKAGPRDITAEVIRIA